MYCSPLGHPFTYMDSLIYETFVTSMTIFREGSVECGGGDGCGNVVVVVVVIVVVMVVVMVVVVLNHSQRSIVYYSHILCQ